MNSLATTAKMIKAMKNNLINAEGLNSKESVSNSETALCIVELNIACDEVNVRATGSCELSSEESSANTRLAAA